MMPMWNWDRHKIIGWGLFCLSLVLNAMFLGYELPNVTTSDEPLVVNRAIAMGTGDLNPHFFLYPTLWIYLVFFMQGIGAAVGLILGLFQNVDHLARLAFADPTYFYTMARLLTAVFGALGVWFVYRFRTYWSIWTGLSGAIGLMFFSPYVRKAHYANPDVPLAAVVIITLFLCLKGLDNIHSSIWSLWIPSIAAGLATSIKYNGFVVVFAVFALQVFVVLSRREEVFSQSLRRIIQSGLISVTVFFLTSPYALLDYPAFLRGLRNVIHGTAVVQSPQPIDHYFWICIENFGWGITLLGTVGCIIPFLSEDEKETKQWIILMIFFLPYLLLIHWSDYKAARFFLPVAFLWPFGVGRLLEQFFQWTGGWARHTILKTVCAGLGIALLVGPVTEVYALEKRIHRLSISTQTSRWINRCVKPGSAILIEDRTLVEVLPDRETVQKRIRRLKKGTENPGKRSQLLRTYTIYLNSNLPEEGYNLVPTANELLNTFNVGYVPEKDYTTENLRQANLVVTMEYRLNSSEPPAKSFYHTVRKEFDHLKRFSNEDGSIVVMKRTTADPNFLSPDCRE
jgi:hypothetical protein